MFLKYKLKCAFTRVLLAESSLITGSVCLLYI